MGCALLECPVQGGGTVRRRGTQWGIKLPPSKSFPPGSPHPCPAPRTHQVAPKAKSGHVLLSTSHPCQPDLPPLTAGSGVEAQGASPPITQREEPQILRSLSAPVTLKGKRAMAMEQSHSSLLIAVLAQDLVTNLLSAQQHPLTEVGAKAGWLWSWEIYSQALLG